MSADEVANAFVNHFYQQFANSPDALAGLYVSKLNRVELERLPGAIRSCVEHLCVCDGLFYYRLLEADLRSSTYCTVAIILIHRLDSPSMFVLFLSC